MKSPLAAAVSLALPASARNSPAMSSPAGLGHMSGSPDLANSPVASASQRLTRGFAHSVSKLAAQSSPAAPDSAIADSATAPSRYAEQLGSSLIRVSLHMHTQGYLWRLDMHAKSAHCFTHPMYVSVMLLACFCKITLNICCCQVQLAAGQQMYNWAGIPADAPAG